MNNLLIEQSIIGHIVNPYALGMDDSALLLLTADDFVDASNKTAFMIAKGMHGNKKVIDPHTLSAEATRQGLRVSYEYLGAVTEKNTTLEQIGAYIELMKRDKHLREIHAKLVELNPEATADSINSIIDLIAKRDSLEKKTTIEAWRIVDGYIVELQSKKSKTINTGFYTIDTYCQPNPGDVVVIGARTNVGKTVCLTNILVNILKNNVPCLYCPTEMKPSQFLDRISPIISNISSDKFRSRNFRSEDISEIPKISSGIRAMPLTILDIAGPSINDIRQAIKNSDCKVLFVDYLGRCSMTREDKRQREIEKFMVELKNLCINNGILCFLAVQLSRVTDSLKEVAPRLADLSDSSAIEKEADSVIFLWRNLELAKKNPNLIAAVIAKNRHGDYRDFEIDFNKTKMMMTEKGFAPEFGADYTEPREGISL